MIIPSVVFRSVRAAVFAANAFVEFAAIFAEYVSVRHIREPRRSVGPRDGTARSIYRSRFEARE